MAWQFDTNLSKVRWSVKLNRFASGLIDRGLATVLESRKQLIRLTGSINGDPAPSRYPALF